MSRGFLRCEVGAGQVVEDEVGKEVGRVLVRGLSAPPSWPSLQPPVQALGGAASPPCCHSKHPVLTRIHNVRLLRGNRVFAHLSPLDWPL